MAARFWLACLKEVINQYQPDIIWFDTWLDQIPEKYRYEFAAYYLNAAEAWGKEVVMTHEHEDMPSSFSLQDLEQGRHDKLTKYPWLLDVTLTKWCWSYVEGQEVKPAEQVVHEFINTVSKNGQLLLNVSPRCDGTIPDEQRAVLAQLGGWLNTNGEAIYETRSWVAYGEGPSQMDQGGHFTERVDYTAKDIRFTTRGDVLYVIALGTPENALIIESLAEGDERFIGSITSVKSLNCNYVQSLKRSADGLEITLRPEAPKQLDYAFKIER